jgi:hypothetical protein
MALHSQAAFDVAYRLAVSPISALHSPGLDMFTNFMHFWAKDVDPDSAADDDYRTMCVLEQFQAQLLSAMRATNAEEASLEAFLSLLRLVSSALTSGITGDDEAMTMRLANVVTKIADEWFQGTSSILCGKACDERVAEQARRTLVISMARIASKASGVISEDLLEPINREWLRYLEERLARQRRRVRHRDIGVLNTETRRKTHELSARALYADVSMWVQVEINRCEPHRRAALRVQSNRGE